MTLRIGTRGSPLALQQARAVADALAARAGVASELVVIKTAGDRLAPGGASGPLGSKRLFVKEIEDALLAGTVDVAVHSAKDLPATLPDGLVLGAVPPRDDPFDVLVLRVGTPQVPDLDALVGALGPRLRIGTSSVRRVAQLRRHLPDATFAPVRGNLDTRLRKLDAGEFDALVLAAAGLRRLGLAHRIAATLPLEVCVPAPGQGALAVERRAADEALGAMLAPIADPVATAALTAERAVVVALGGSCQMPLGALAWAEGTELVLDAVVAAPDGSALLRRSGRARLDEAAALGADVGRALLAAGAAALLRAASPAAGREEPS